jgi:hypothetical protein
MNWILTLGFGISTVLLLIPQKEVTTASLTFGGWLCCTDAYGIWQGQ